MPPALPQFLQGPPVVWRMRRSRRLNRPVYCDRSTGLEYEPDKPKRSWHEIDALASLYRDLDPLTGQPWAGSPGQWRPLR